MCNYFLIKPEPTDAVHADSNKQLYKIVWLLHEIARNALTEERERVSVCNRWSSCTTPTTAAEYEKCIEINWRRKINGNISLMVMLLFRHSDWMCAESERERASQRSTARAAIGVIIIYHSVVLPKSNRIISAIE